MTPSPKLRPYTPLRFCLSCLGTLACWALWIVLIAALAAQVFVLFAQDLRVPDFVLRRIEARLAESNFTVAFGRGSFDPTGRIFLQDVRLSPTEFHEPLLRARGLYAHKSLWSFLSGRTFPDEIRIDGATLMLPAIMSPSGAAEPLVQELTATLRFAAGVVHVDQAAFKVGKLNATIRGEYVLEPRKEGAGRAPLAELTRQFLEHGRGIVMQLPRLESLDRPNLDVLLSGTPGAGNFARIAFMADGMSRSSTIPLDAGRLRATAHVALPWSAARPLRVAFAAESVAYAERAAAGSVEGIAVARFSESTRRPESAEVSLAAHSVVAFEERSEAPVIHAEWRKGGRLVASMGLPLRDKLLSADAEIDLAAKSAVVTASGHVAPSFVASVLPRRAPRFDPYFRFEDAPWINATVRFAEGWKFAGLSALARAGRLNSRDVPISAVRGRIEIAPNGDFHATEARAAMGEMQATGGYWMNFKSLDFRFLLSGNVQPAAIGGWFRSEWWPNLWRNFQFPGAAPLSDVDVRGNWRNAGRTFYFGATAADAAIVQGADFERARVRVLVKPQLVHAMDIDVRRAGGTQKASGWFARHTSSGESRELRALDYDLNGQLEPAIMEKLGGEAAVSLLKPWKFTNAPEVRFRGRTTYSSGRGVPELHFNGRANGGLSYYGFPLDTVEAEGGASGTDVRLDRIEFAVADGFGRGKAALSGPEENRSLGFDLYVAGADLVRSIRAIREFDAARDNTTPTTEDSALMKRASGGKLEAAMSAQGNPDQLASFVGSGNLKVKGAELGEVNLFGLLSQVLSTFSLNFSTLKLDELQGSFRLADGRAHFPDLRVLGPNSVIEADGRYDYVKQTLDFKAHFKPYESGRNIITAALGMVVNPLSSIFELRLTGPLAKPNWSVSLGSTAPAKSEQPASAQPSTGEVVDEPKR